MSAVTRLPDFLQKAILKGRGILMLDEYRFEELPRCSLTVIALIDDPRFMGVFLDDALPAPDFVAVPIPAGTVIVPPDIRSDSKDAKVIHLLWSEWQGGAREHFVQFGHNLARLIAQAEVKAALSNAVLLRDDGTTTGSASKSKKTRATNRPASSATRSGQRRPSRPTTPSASKRASVRTKGKPRREG